MATPSVTVGQGQGVPVEFGVKQGSLAVSDYKMTVAASKGLLVKADTTVSQGAKLVTSGDTIVAGFLNDTAVDVSALPADVQKNIFAMGLLDSKPVGEPVTVWKIGRFFVTAVTGTVADGDFLKPSTATDGFVMTSTTTNALKNGSIMCLKGNGGVSGGPIEVFTVLA